MNTSPPSDDIESTVRTYANMLYRLSLSMLGSSADAEDAVQETFLRYVQKAPDFESAAHEKAWLIRVCINRCRDEQRRRRRDILPQESSAGNIPDIPIMEALRKLPEKFRLVMMLHYSEGYPVDDIAKIIRRTPSAVKMRLKKGRQLLKEILGKEYM